jgi:hypothetical protein
MLFVLLCASSCSVAFQKSVRSSKADCSDSRFWWMSDVLIAGGLAYAASANGAPATAYSLPALFIGSALIGSMKRGNCVRYRGEQAMLQAQGGGVAPVGGGEAGDPGVQADGQPEGQPEGQVEGQPGVQVGVQVGSDPNYPPPPDVQVEAQPDPNYPAPPQNYPPPPANVRPTVRTTVRTNHTQVTGSTTITINGCTYTDRPQGFTGRSCGNGCPGGYTCLGSSGNICVSQQAQACRPRIQDRGAAQAGRRESRERPEPSVVDTKRPTRRSSRQATGSAEARRD